MNVLIDFFFQVILNFPLMIALASMAIAQIAKLIYYYFREGELNLFHFIEAGGMPSAHSATVSSMTMAIGLTSGFSSAYFALSLVFSLVVMYDAMGVRRAASKQAFILNKIVDDMYGNNKGKIEKLKELMGHSPVEVLVGSILGIGVSIVLYVLIYLI